MACTLPADPIANIGFRANALSAYKVVWIRNRPMTAELQLRDKTNPFSTP